MTRPNILLVTIDSLRADYVYGNNAETPTMDSLCDEGIVYENAFAQGPFTTFSMPSMFTGRYPSGLSYVTFSENTVGVAIDDEPTIPGVLQAAGYQTGGFHSNPLLSNLFGFAEGFDKFDARLPFSNTDWLSGRAKILADKVARLVRTHAYLPAPKLNQRALEWLAETDRDKPFFCWIHYMDVHGPYQAKEGNRYLNKYRGERLWRKAVTQPEAVTDTEHEQLRDLYRTEVEYTDKCLGNLLDELESRGLREETIVALTADHGEQFMEHSEYSHPHQLYDELLHVPMVFAGDGLADEVASDVVPVSGLASSLVKQAGERLPDSFVIDSLEAHHEAVLSEANLHPSYVGGVRTTDWKYIHDDRAEHALFNLRADPDEQANVVSENPSVAAEFADRLSAHLAEPDRSTSGEVDATDVSVDGLVENRLEDLGYM